MIKKISLLLVLLSVSFNSIAVELYTELPSKINANESYVIYSHGLIVEGTNPRPVHPKFGTYEFEEIKRTLFGFKGFNLIAHHRPVNTSVGTYVETLVSWVRRLVDAGVKPSKITLIGFSRGSHLSAYASDKLRDLNINTVLLASCINGDISAQSPLVLSGNLLSIYETSDVPGTCEKLIVRSDLISVEELSISTGLSHGAFYRPLPEWTAPLKRWIHEKNR